MYINIESGGLATRTCCSLLMTSVPPVLLCLPVSLPYTSCSSCELSVSVFTFKRNMYRLLKEKQLDVKGLGANLCEEMIYDPLRSEGVRRDGRRFVVRGVESGVRGRRSPLWSNRGREYVLRGDLRVCFLGERNRCGTADGGGSADGGTWLTQEGWKAEGLQDGGGDTNGYNHECGRTKKHTKWMDG